MADGIPARLSPTERSAPGLATAIAPIRRVHTTDYQHRHADAKLTPKAYDHAAPHRAGLGQCYKSDSGAEVAQAACPLTRPQSL